MAAPDVAKNVALRIKMHDLATKGHNERHVAYLSRALEAAQALGVQDCLITARVQLDMVVSRLQPALTCGDLSARQALFREGTELLLSAGAALQARRAAGTLLPGALHPWEVAYEVGFLVHFAQLLGAKPAVLSRFKVMAGFFGYATFIYGAGHAANVQSLCSIRAVSLTTAQRDELWALLADGLDMMAASGTTDVASIAAQTEEATLVNNTRELLRDGFLPASAAGARVLDAWRRLERSGVLDAHDVGDSIKQAQSLIVNQKLAAEAAAAAPGLRSCALAGCGSRERHPAHFKSCGACKTVVYCSKEHQTEDWPAHKAACKAARKAAADTGAAGA